MVMVFSLSFTLGTTLYALDRVDPVTTIVFYCKMRTYLNQCSSMIYRWCLVLASLDRCALSSAHARLRNFASVSLARRVIAGLVVFWVVITIYRPLIHNIASGRCGIQNVGVALFTSIYTAVLATILPSSSMIICAVLIHQNLRLKRQLRRLNINEQSERKGELDGFQRRRDKQVLIMLLVQATAYIACTSPLMAFQIYTAATVYVVNKSESRVMAERFFFFMGETTNALFPVLSFYLYTASSSTFRNELLVVFRSVLPCKFLPNNRRIAPSMNTISHGGIDNHQQGGNSWF